MKASQVLLVCIFLKCFCNAVYAQENGERSIDEFLWGSEMKLVTATREAEHPFEAPATVAVITAEMIRERGYRDLKEIFGDIPGFDVSDGVYAEFSSLIAQRGIGGNNKLVILLDGREITSPSGKQFPFGHNVPISLAKRIEIVYGPASAIYGPDAFGVVNIITKDALDVDGIDIYTSSGTENTYDTSLHYGKNFTKDVLFTAYGRFYNTKGQDLSNEYEELNVIRSYPSLVRNRMEDPVTDWNVITKLQIKDITLNVNHSIYKEQLSNGLDPSHYVYNKEAWWGQRITNIGAEHRYSTPRFDLTSRASFNVFEINPDMSWYYLIRDQDAGEFSTFKVHQYGKTNGTSFDIFANYEYNNGITISGGVAYEDITGMEVADVYGAPFDTNKPLLVNNYGIPQAAVSSQNYGIYGQIKWQLSANLKAILGTRYDYNTIYKETFNPRIGIIYGKPGRQVFKVLYGSAYIAPSYFHRYETWFVEEYGHIQNPDLKPETMKSIETNWTRTWSNRLESSVSLYYNHVENLIVGRYYGYYPMTDPFVDSSGDDQVFTEWSENFGELVSYGTEVMLGYAASPDFRMYCGYSFLNGHNSDPNTGEELDLFKTSIHKMSAGFTWYPHKRISISPRFRWVGDIATRKENTLYAGSRMPGYYFLNLHARMNNIMPHADLFITVSNLLNKHYYTPGVQTESSVFLPRVPQYLRSIMVGVSYWPSF